MFSPRNMMVFLGVLMVLIVSGDAETVTPVNGVSGDSILLQCNCSNRNQEKEFKWQMESIKLVFNSSAPSSIDDTYKGRTKAFPTEKGDNCSILLTNITPLDQGMYKCIFHIGEAYQRSYVNLSISVLPAVSEEQCRSDVNLNGTNTGCQPVRSPEPEDERHRYYTLIPIMLVLPLSLFLWRRRNSPQRSMRPWEVVTDI